MYHINALSVQQCRVSNHVSDDVFISHCCNYTGTCNALVTVRVVHIWKKALQSLGEFCLRHAGFQWSWYHSLLSGWVEICYVSSQVEDSRRWRLIVLSPHTALITRRCLINNRQNVYLLCLRKASVSSKTVSVPFTDKWLDNKYNSPWFSLAKQAGTNSPRSL